MALLYVGSVGSHSGKNVVCLGLGRRMLDDGLSLGYLKPYGATPLNLGETFSDEDAWMINKALDLGQSPEQCCPVVRTQDLVANTLRHRTGDLLPVVRATLGEVSRDRQLTILSGAGTMASGAFCGLSGYRLVQELGARVLLVDRYENDFFLDNLVCTAQRLGQALLGVVINSVDLEMSDALENQILPFLEQEGVLVLGRLPKDDLLGAVSLGVLMELLSGQVLSGQAYTGRLVKRFFIGAMQVRHAPKFFSTQRDFGCIVGGDRPDMQLAAIESGAACLILTGNFYPSDIILSRAEEHQVLVMLVRQDTFSIAQHLEQIIGRNPLREPEKIQRSTELVGRNVNFKALYQALGLAVPGAPE